MKFDYVSLFHVSPKMLDLPWDDKSVVGIPTSF